MADGLLAKRIGECSSLAKAIAADAELQSKVEALAGKIAECCRSGGKVILMGNGGSSSQALHIAAELEGKYLKDRAPLHAVALGANVASTTAIGNDFDFSRVFSRQLEGCARKGDVAIALSTSGNSPNVVEAAKWARKNGIFFCALVGRKKCALDSSSALSIKVPSDSVPRIQEMHLLLLHTVCEIAENELFP